VGLEYIENYSYGMSFYVGYPWNNKKTSSKGHRLSQGHWLRGLGLFHERQQRQTLQRQTFSDSQQGQANTHQQ